MTKEELNGRLIAIAEGEADVPLCAWKVIGFTIS